MNFQFTINVLVNVMTTGTLGYRKTISFAVMEKGKPMDEIKLKPCPLCGTPNTIRRHKMNTWLSNFSEYKGILNPLCISCKNKEICKRIIIDRLDVDYTFCEGDDYINETEK